jgi:two-component system CheB/CheR fusion protein
LFRRKGSMSLPLLERKSRASYSHPLLPSAAQGAKARRRVADLNVADAGITALLNHFAPPAVLVNENHEAVHLYGEVNRYLHAKAGAASLEINRLLPSTLTPVASALLYKAVRDRCSLVSDSLGITLHTGEQCRLRLSAHPLDNGSEERLTLLCFEAEAITSAMEMEPVNVDAETIARVTILERELAATRESLQATIEELETSNEELQATNEELMASNEELQSSNEELQSVNEEMSTVNAEFQEKMLIVNRVNADLDSMAKAAAVATVFVDSQLIITRFSPDATQVFKLRDSDVGRPLDEIANVLRYPDLIEDLETTLTTDRMIEREINTRDDKKTFLVRLLPYQVPSSSVRGAVASFVDVTSYHDARRLQSIIDALPEHIAVVDPAGTIVIVNSAWKRFARANGDKDLKHTGPGTNYLEVCQPDMSSDGPSAGAAALGLRGVLEGSLPTFSLKYPCHSPTEQRWFVMNVAPVIGNDFGAVISHINISPWYQGEAP